MDPRSMAMVAHSAFEEAGWEYIDGDGSPSVDDLEETVRELIADCPIDEEEWTFCETGRLRVQREIYQEEGQDPHIEWGIFLRLDA